MDTRETNIWEKLKAVVQIAAIALLMLPLPIGLTWGQWVFWAAVALTLISGLIYLQSGLGRSATSANN